MLQLDQKKINMQPPLDFSHLPRQARKWLVVNYLQPHTGYWRFFTTPKDHTCRAYLLLYMLNQFDCFNTSPHSFFHVAFMIMCG